MTVYVGHIKDALTYLTGLVDANDLDTALPSVRREVETATARLETAIDDAMTGLEAAMVASGGISRIVSGAAPADSALVLQGAIADMRQMSTLVDARSYCRRVALNLKLASGGRL